MLIFSLGFIGFLLSLYGVYLHEQTSKDTSYQALCDISHRMSCTKAFRSGYGSLLLIPNALWGLGFYFLVMIFADVWQVAFFLALVAILGSVVLAFISYVIQRNFCVVCTSVYVVNILLLMMVLK